MCESTATTLAAGPCGRCAALASALARASGETLRPESPKVFLRHELAPMEDSTATAATAADRLANRTFRVCSTTRSPLWLALNLETAMMRSVDTCGELTFTVIHPIDIRHPLNSVGSLDYLTHRHNLYRQQEGVSPAAEFTPLSELGA